MAFPKYKPTSPPKDKIVKEKRLVNGKLMPVETFNGKVVRVFDDEGNVVEDRSTSFGDKLPPLPEARPKPKVEEVSNIDQDKKDETPKVEMSEYDKLMKMPDEQFRTEIASMSDSGFEGYMRKLGLSSDEKADIRGKRIDLRNIPNVDQEKKEEIPKVEQEDIPKIGDKKPEDVPKLDIPKVDTPNVEVPEFPNSVSSTSSPTSISGTSGIPLVSKEETVGQGSGPVTAKAEVVSPKPEEITDAGIITKEGGTTTHIPKIEPIIPKIEIPKSEPPKEVKKVPVPGVGIPVMGRLSKIMEEKTKDDKTKDENIKEDKGKSSDIIQSESSKEETPKEVPKAEIPKDIPKEAPKIGQSKIKKPKEVKHFMAEEDEEIMQERKFEQWLKKNRFQESVEKTAKIAEESQGQIKDISNEITNVKEGLGTVENRIDTLKEGLNSVIGETKKPIVETLGELCEGVDCIKKDVAKYQDIQSELDKKLDTRFSELRERVQKLEEPTFTCDNCGADGIKPLSSFCPNCGAPIHEWNDENGQPVRGWVPYWKRVRQAV